MNSECNSQTNLDFFLSILDRISSASVNALAIAFNIECK